MKEYWKVIEERYDGRERDVHIYNNPYSLINPIGFYANMQIRRVFYRIFNKLREGGTDIASVKILDIGCGSGLWSRYFADLTGTPENISGLDLSKYRINQAKTLNPSIEYIYGDIVNMPEFKNKWDIITSITVFMHLSTEQQILNALKGVYENLNQNGIFILYDAYAYDHFARIEGAESMGYNPKQIKNLCKKVGFKNLYSMSLFKKIFKYHSAYLCEKLPFWLVFIVEKLVPGNPGNIILVFQKN